MITIDGSQGEGGGQILRSSLALSLVTGQSFSIHNVRSGRKKPGLLRQHLTAVHAAAEVGGARLLGAGMGSQCLSFEPSGIRASDYVFDVQTAGSATLVLQTVLPALLMADGPSTLSLEGGTHNPAAPPFDFLACAYLPLVNRMGPNVRVDLVRPGFYPAGGGQLKVHVQPAKQLDGFELAERGEIVRRRVSAMVANLPLHIAKRECQTFARQSGWDESCFEIQEITNSRGPGNVLIVQVECQHVTEVFTGFGQRGVKAERVAHDVWRSTEAYLDATVPVGPYLADQLLLPFGIAAHHGHRGSFRTMKLTRHSTTHVEILRRFLAIHVELRSESPDVVLVEISPG